MVLEPDMQWQTGTDARSPATRANRDADARRAWQRLIDETLLKWLLDPESLSDAGVDPPTKTILRLAVDFAELYRDRGLSAPDRIVPDPNGGIVFERREGAVSETVHVWDDGSIEYLRFEGDRLVERGPVGVGR